ncbi:MAG: hypothetical protein ACRDA3_07765 [Peptostreptococcaceae bacterium]
MRTKNIDLTFKIKSEIGNYNMMETLVVDEKMTIVEVESILKNTYNNEIMLISYSENSSVNN